MLQTLRNSWAIPELRKKLLYTLFILVIFRLGVAIAVPFINPDVLKTAMGGDSGILNYLDTLSGGSFSQSTIFALSITPYINSSIIMQLLTYALPPLERLQKEGPTGRKKIQKITRVVTVVLSIAMSIAYYFLLKNTQGALIYTSGFEGFFTAVVIVLCFAAGAAMIVWLGDKITEKGIGNGISIILFAGILGRLPTDINALVKGAQAEPQKYAIFIPVIIIIFLAMIAFIILMNHSERRIPIQYAKRVVGRKMYGGQNTHIPIKVAMSGVMPIIFAMTFMSIPQTIDFFVTKGAGVRQEGLYGGFMRLFSPNSWFYAIFYFILIIAFNYFYVSMQYNPIEIANNLRQNNGGIPGIRPGRPTSDFIKRVLSKITLVGAFFLGVIAIFPIFFAMGTGIQIAMGGTSILILCSVALETVRTLESQMMMRHHKGFLE